MRYEEMHDRAFRANLAHLVKLKKAGADLASSDDTLEDETPPPAPNEANRPGVGDKNPCWKKSCGKRTGENAVGVSVDAAPIEADAGRVEAVAPSEATVAEIPTADRGLGGRIEPVRGVDGGSDGPRWLPMYR